MTVFSVCAITNQKGDVMEYKKDEFSGYRLKRFLDDRGIKYGAFGASLTPPVSNATISRWLHGKAKPAGKHAYNRMVQISVKTQKPGRSELHASIRGWNNKP